MITDCHTHIKNILNDAETAEFLDSCGKVDACFVLTKCFGAGAAANGEMAEFVKDKPKLIGFGAFHPIEDKVGVKNVRSVTVDPGLKGVVLYCSQGKFHPTHSRAMRFYEAAEELSLPVFFHNGPELSFDAVLDFAQPYLLDEVARKFPALKIIIGSMGMPFLPQTIAMIAKHENIYADLSICPSRVWEVYNIVISCSEADVMDKLLFGSGYPNARADECIETLLGFNKLMADMSLPSVRREKIREVVERDTLELLGIGRA